MSLLLMLALLGAGTRPDLDYLSTTDPAGVSDAALLQYARELETRYWRWHQVNGISYAARWADADSETPSLYGSGGDSALFTGFHLAAEVYRYRVTGDRAALTAILETLRGLHILTHVTGTPGVLLRCAIPAADAERWEFPSRWTNRIDRGHVYETPAGTVPDVLHRGQFYEPMVVYARTSRDQLTGVLFGLAVVLGELQSKPESPEAGEIETARAIAAQIARSLWTRLDSTGFVIEDHMGNRFRSSSQVSGVLKLQLLAVCRAASPLWDGPPETETLEAMYGRTWRRVFRFGSRGGWGDWLNRWNNVFDYYAWNLRFARAYSVYLLEGDTQRQQTIAGYVDRRIWRYVDTHQNAHFTFLRNAVHPASPERLEGGVIALKSWSLRPQRSWDSPLDGQERVPSAFRRLFCDVSDDVVPPQLRAPTHYFVWQKDPFAVDQSLEAEGIRQSPGTDFLLPYWFGRYHGFF